MPHLKWTENSLRGVQKVYRFLAQYDLEAAKAAVKTIQNKAAILKRHPEAGRPADDLDPEHRELVIPFGASGYVLIYEVHQDYILVLAVKHQKEAGY
ncbi:type II toxin-antitoxin system RelE/ParE family toxin [Deltaproteobacteria bacterium OttesenSCG-928-M10]|nr:type II toxin-antitoxin system RelE/ParE family toxin [Deltaproteobacteria bacterium OttesenSCG-928-M10]